MSQGTFGGFQVRDPDPFTCAQKCQPPLRDNLDTPHQCKPDDLFRERLGNNRRMDIRTSFTPTPMEGVVQPEPAQRSYKSVVPLLEEEDD